MKRFLEIACFNLSSAIIAQHAGADRIELCENYLEGGLTPSPLLLKEVTEKTTLPVFVMIRPRKGNFNYTSREIANMKQNIELYKQDSDGFVFGILNENNTVNHSACKELVKLAHPLPCTFHRAFDAIENSDLALEDLIDCGFKQVLTSGKGKTAVEGITLIQSLIEKANERITIMPGGSIRSNTIKTIVSNTKAIWYHSAAIVSKEVMADTKEIQDLKKQLN